MTVKLISTPLPGYDGKVGSVQFVDGLAKVDDSAQEMAYFRSAGYGIADVEDAVDAADEVDPDLADEIEDLDEQGGTPDADPQVVVEVDDEQVVLPRKSASADEWRKFALDHDPKLTEDEVAGMSRADLIARFTDEDEKEAGQ